MTTVSRCSWTNRNFTSGRPRSLGVTRKPLARGRLVALDAKRHHFDFFTREEARLAIFDYVEAFYNRNRIRSSLDYHSPEEYETLHNAA